MIKVEVILRVDAHPPMRTEVHLPDDVFSDRDLATGGGFPDLFAMVGERVSIDWREFSRGGYAFPPE